MQNTNDVTDKNKSVTLKPYLSVWQVWALSLGCAVGWGAFVMPGTTFLPVAGPLGSLLGMLIGGAVMLVIGVNYHYMMQKVPDAGGTLSYSSKAFGFDHGFMSAWCLMQVYIPIAWANATALPLILRNFMGNTFCVGYLYTIAGYDIYIGEVAVSLVTIMLLGGICMFHAKLAAHLQTVMAIVLLGGIFIGFFSMLFSAGGTGLNLSPSFPPGKTPLFSVINIVALAPWAFVGFESISHSREEFTFSGKKTFPILLGAVVAGTLAYLFLALMSVSVLPKGYASWPDYIGSLDKLSGITGLPVLNAYHSLLGQAGLILLGCAVLAGVGTGLLGNTIAASRLLFSMSRKKLLPEWFSRLNRKSIPGNAILFIMLISIPIPFLGRTAINWIVDINTIGASIAYAYTSYAALKSAKQEKNTLVTVTGSVGLLFSLAFFLYFMVPNIWTVTGLSAQSYLILMLWSMAGLLFFRYVFIKDEDKRFGKSTMVWIVLVFMIFFTSMLWLMETGMHSTQAVLEDINAEHQTELFRHGVNLTSQEAALRKEALAQQMDRVNQSLRMNSMIQMGIICLALLIMFRLYRSITERQKKLEVGKLEAERNSFAKSIFLSNMSHDIRTPMNAITGFVTLAKKEEAGLLKDYPGDERLRRVFTYVTKIETSGSHLLALINDVLDMSRIESGKLELRPEPTDLTVVLSDIRDLFTAQMESKSILFSVICGELENPRVLCDAHRLNRILLNLVGNACKFTPEGKSIEVTLVQTGATADTGSYRLTVRDTGIGMSQEFAAKIFDAYERDRRVDHIQGTGLGMAITKTLVDMMGGSITLVTEEEKGTEFILTFDFPLVEEAAAKEEADELLNLEDQDFTGTKLLLAEDNEINREIARMFLEEAGFEVEDAENGQEALDLLKKKGPGYYQCILMDIQMPVMNGYDASRAIRKLPDRDLASIPIIAMTANAFSEDIQDAKDAGMDSHIAKPIDEEKLNNTLKTVLLRRRLHK